MKKYFDIIIKPRQERLEEYLGIKRIAVQDLSPKPIKAGYRATSINVRTHKKTVTLWFDPLGLHS